MIYVVRHGETIQNASNCLCGRINSPLTEEGIKQAEVVRDMFKEKNIDLIISSPLDRCKMTAETIGDKAIPIIYSDKLLGRDHGEFTGVSRFDMPYDEYWNIIKDVHYESAESVKDLYNRAASLIEEIKLNYKDKNVILVTHSGIMRMLYYYFNGIPEDGILAAVTIKNCQVYEYEIEEEE